MERLLPFREQDIQSPQKPGHPHNTRGDNSIVLYLSLAVRDANSIGQSFSFAFICVLNLSTFSRFIPVIRLRQECKFTPPPARRQCFQCFQCYWSQVLGAVYSLKKDLHRHFSPSLFPQQLAFTSCLTSWLEGSVCGFFFFYPCFYSSLFFPPSIILLHHIRPQWSKGRQPTLSESLHNLPAGLWGGVGRRAGASR